MRRIDGLGPAVALGQRVGLSNPRSTVGTMSDGWDLRLRLVGLIFGHLALGELRGLLVVPDEPSSGLHPYEVGRLIRVL